MNDIGRIERDYRDSIIGINLAHERETDRATRDRDAALDALRDHCGWERDIEDQARNRASGGVDIADMDPVVAMAVRQIISRYRKTTYRPYPHSYEDGVQVWIDAALITAGVITFDAIRDREERRKKQDAVITVRGSR